MTTVLALVHPTGRDLRAAGAALACFCAVCLFVAWAMCRSSNTRGE